MYKRFVTIAGRTIIIRECESRCRAESRKRKKKINRTPEAVSKINQINRERDLTVKLNSNFGFGDLWLTIGYDFHEAGGKYLQPEECMKRIRKFKRSIMRWAKKNEKIVKIVKIIDSFGIGTRKGKPHHHLVMNEIPMSVLKKYWKEGAIHIEVLWPSGNYQRVAKYMLKNAEDAKRMKPELVGKRAYNCTRNVITPETRAVELKRDMVIDTEDISSPFKGYSIDRDTIRKYEHPFSEVECIEYILVSLEENPRLQRGRGRKVKPERIYRETIPEELERT